MEKKMKILFVLRHIEGVKRKLSVNGTNNFIENYNFFIFNIHCERMQLKKQNLNSILHSINAFNICITMFICIYMYIIYLFIKLPRKKPFRLQRSLAFRFVPKGNTGGKQGQRRPATVSNSPLKKIKHN